MSKSRHNDQAHIAENFKFLDEHTAQTARLAFFKVQSYKLSLIKTTFNPTREEMTAIIRHTLFNYVDPAKVLKHLDFFKSESEN